MASLDLSGRLPALTSAAGRRAATLALPLSAVAALVLGLLLLTRRALSADEAVAVERARQPFGDLLERAVEHDPASLGSLSLLHPVVSWSDSEWAVRLPAVAGALLAALLAYALGRVLFGPVAGAVAAVALALHAGVVAASQQVRPYTLAIAAILLASLVLVLALERSPTWWLAYVPACALLALTHPLAVTVVAAHVVAAALALHGSRRHLGWSAAGLALGVAAAAPLALAAVADRSDAADGSGGFDVRELTTGLGRAAGWNAALLALAGLGLVVLVGGRLAGAAPWHAALVGGLVAAPLIGVLLAEPFLPVFPQRALVVCAPGLALACGAGVAWMPRRAWRWAAVGAVGALALPALAGWYATPAPEDWRSAVRELEAARDERETVVVVPERAAAAVAYYAPELRLSGRARGDGAWVFVRSGSDRLAIRAARRVVRTPAYALLAQERHGERLVLQHWVRP